jgi:hypothetical protein
MLAVNSLESNEKYFGLSQEERELLIAIETNKVDRYKGKGCTAGALKCYSPIKN